MPRYEVVIAGYFSCDWMFKLSTWYVILCDLKVFFICKFRLAWWDEEKKNQTRYISRSNQYLFSQCGNKNNELVLKYGAGTGAEVRLL